MTEAEFAHCEAVQRRVRQFDALPLQQSADFGQHDVVTELLLDEVAMPLAVFPRFAARPLDRHPKLDEHRGDLLVGRRCCALAQPALERGFDVAAGPCSGSPRSSARSPSSPRRRATGGPLLSPRALSPRETPGRPPGPSAHRWKPGGLSRATREPRGSMPLRNLAPEGSMLVRRTYAEGSMLLRNDTLGGCGAHVVCDCLDASARDGGST